MGGYERVLEVVCEAIREFNGQESDVSLAPSPGTVLIGDGSVLDSLRVVTFASIVEEHMERHFGETVSVIDIFGAADAIPFDVAGLARGIARKMGTGDAG